MRSKLVEPGFKKKTTKKFKYLVFFNLKKYVRNAQRFPGHSIEIDI